MTRKGCRNGFGRFCHTCKYDGKRDTACLSCKGFAEFSTLGHNIHFDAYEDMELAMKKLAPSIAAAYRPGAPSMGIQLVGVTDNARDCMLALLAEASMLADEDAPLMVKLIGGRSEQDICREFRLSTDILRLIWIALKNKYPICAAYVRRINASIDSEPVENQPPDGQNPDGPSGGQTTSGEIERG